MTQPSDSQRLAGYLLSLHGDDPYAHVRDASNTHREAHGPDCGVYPSDPLKMRLLATLVRATGGQRILEIGCGLGYSALWLADAAGPGARVETIDRFPQHADLARAFASQAGLGDRVLIITGEGAEVLPTLKGPYDLIHDDGWFAQEPAYFDDMLRLLRPGGLLALSNWFLLEEALVGGSGMDWAQFAGPNWSSDVQAYAAKLAAHPQLHVSFVLRPAMANVALAVKVP